MNKYFHSRTGIIHQVAERIDEETVKTECGRTYLPVPESETLEGTPRGNEACKQCTGGSL